MLVIAILRGLVLAAVIATGSGIPQSAHAAQVFQDVGQVGQWKIQSGSENGKFLFCRAIGRASNGELALVYWTDGKWRLSMSDFGLPPGRKFRGMMELRRGSIPFDMVSNPPGLRESILLNNALLEGMRQGGFIQLQVGGKTFTMQMENNAEAMRAVADCRNAGMRGGPQPVAGGGAVPQNIDTRREYYEGRWIWTDPALQQKNIGNVSRLQFNASGERAAYCYNATCWNVKIVTTPDGGFSWSNNGTDHFKFEPVSTPSQLKGRFSASFLTGKTDATVVFTRKP